MYAAGSGQPLLFLHGAGTFHGFEFAGKWTENFRVLVPYHPGFGESDDDPTMLDMHDYVMHYVELLDTLGIEKVNLVGFSLGGYLAARFAIEHRERVIKLALIGPAGLRDKDNPPADVLALSPEQLPPLLVSNFDVIKPHLPVQPDLDFIADRYREMTTVARLLWEKPWDRKLPRHLHRLKMPTLLLWGEEDKIIPSAQAKLWKSLIPAADVEIVGGAGHLVLDEKPEAVTSIARFLS
ncbi:MAG: alpha/beta fold hydrolase [Bradyrhizobium sp.]|uniref:alpha/beta fold hydrolase n=1 Tax=Bradyrhizobium sp. TaxID=376 RepID=UPI001D4ACA3A|nr:alpha/beta fold hydrolase [Bradyrhizobium sp.]MBV9561372.1 alpha/beta fold hydrolase [Bradyrhizobium sp.]